MSNLITDDISRIPSVKAVGEISLKIIDGKIRVSRIFDENIGKNKHFDCSGPFVTIQLNENCDKMFICDSNRITAISSEGKLAYQYPLQTIQDIVTDDLISMLNIQN